MRNRSIVFRWASFLWYFQQLHNVVYGAEGMYFFIKVFCETGSVAIVTEGFLMFIVSCSEASFGLSNI